MEGNTNSAREQFEQEAEALKQIIYEFIDGGHIIMAAQVLEQYALLSPDDPDLSDIRSMLYPQGLEVPEDEIPGEYKILENIETIFILSGIITRRTGYIDSVLRKINLMREKWNYSPLLLTCVHNIDQRQAQTWLNTAGVGQVTLGADTRVLNVYDYFQKSYAEGLENKAVYSSDEKHSGQESSVSGTDIETKEYYTGYMGSLRMVSYYKAGNLDKDMVYDDWGYLNYIREYSPLSEDIYDIKYFTTDGKLCIEAFFRPVIGGLEHEKLIVYNDKGEVAAECKNSAELAAICLERMMANNKFYLLVVEDGLMSKAATMIKRRRENIAKCIVVHNIFLNDAYKPESGPQTYYKYLCENHTKFNGIIMLTEDARRDFGSQYGSPDNIFVVPHPYPYEIKKVDFSKRDNMKAVVVARLDPFKQIGLAVEIFALVTRELPDAQLEIYGRGPQEEHIRGLIKKLGLENNVFLKGYTDEPLAVFNTAVLSMMTSKAEGFGLTLMESICNGCPAFAFDIKYGPSEIIKEGRTGFLFPRFDKNKFAQGIIEYLRDKRMQRDMSGNCYAAAHAFSTDRFMDTWYKMTESLYGRYNTHSSI